MQSAASWQLPASGFQLPASSYSPSERRAPSAERRAPSAERRLRGSLGPQALAERRPSDSIPCAHNAAEVRMQTFLAEAIGTMMLVVLGDGVVANVILTGTKGEKSGWIVITTGWGVAVAMGVYAVGRISGAHLNPAVTIALATIGSFSWAEVPGYIAAQMLGAFVGAVIVYIAYFPHWRVTTDPGTKLAVFATGPAIRHTGANLATEIIGTAALLFGILAIAGNEQTLMKPGDLNLSAVFSRGLQPLLVGILVLGVGLSLGGPTGYAINPARDLGPRIAHAVLPIPGKGSSDWSYAWIPVVGPIIGGILGAGLYAIVGF
jgi:glycerol uptake facilitator protein